MRNIKSTTVEIIRFYKTKAPSTDDIQSTTVEIIRFYKTFADLCGISNLQQ